MNGWLQPILISLALSALGAAAVTYRDVASMRTDMTHFEKDLDRIRGQAGSIDELEHRVATNAHEIESLRDVDARLEERTARVDERVKTLEKKR